jgi:hypothetical protein
VNKKKVKNCLERSRSELRKLAEISPPEAIPHFFSVSSSAAARTLGGKPLRISSGGFIFVSSWILSFKTLICVSSLQSLRIGRFSGFWVVRGGWITLTSPDDVLGASFCLYFERKAHGDGLLCFVEFHLPFGSRGAKEIQHQLCSPRSFSLNFFEVHTRRRYF